MKKPHYQFRKVGQKRLLGRLLAAWHLFRHHQTTDFLTHFYWILVFLLSGESKLHGVYYKYHHLWFLPKNSEKHNLAEIFEFKLYDFPDIAEDSTIVDIGGHIGDSAIFFRDKWPKAKIFSYEPNPESCQLFQLNTTHNLGNLHNLSLYKEAVVAETESKAEIELFVEPEASSRSTINLDCVISKSNLEVIQVKTVKFSKLVERARKKIDLLKIDAEGAEFGILADLIRYHTCIKSLAIELHYRRDMSNPNSVYSLIEKLSQHYSILLLPPQYLSQRKSQLSELFQASLPESYSLMLYGKHL